MHSDLSRRASYSSNKEKNHSYTKEKTLFKDLWLDSDSGVMRKKYVNFAYFDLSLQM